MNEFPVDWAATLGNVIGGVASGITVILIVGVYLKIRKAFVRRDQVRHFRQIVTHNTRQILHEVPPEGFPEASKVGIDLTENRVRYLLFAEMCWSIDSAIDRRSSEIAYDKTHELREHLRLVNWIVDNGAMPPKRIYDPVMKDLWNVRWLGIRDEYPSVQDADK